MSHAKLNSFSFFEDKFIATGIVTAMLIMMIKTCFWTNEPLQFSLLIYLRKLLVWSCFFPCSFWLLLIENVWQNFFLQENFALLYVLKKLCSPLHFTVLCISPMHHDFNDFTFFPVRIKKHFFFNCFTPSSVARAALCAVICTQIFY